MSYKDDKNLEDLKKDTHISPELDEIFYKKKTMSLSIREGYFGGLTQTLADQFITPYALNLQTTPTQLGVMSSLLGITSPIGQLIGSKLMKRSSRRRIVVKGVFFQALMWPLIILLGVFALNGWILSILPTFLICFYILYSFLGSITGPSWFSLMGDIVPEDQRGRYFSKRNLIITAISFSIGIAASIALDWFERLDRVFIGFFIIFFIAFISRLISVFFLTLHYDPPFKIEKHSYVSFKKFLKQIPNSNFGLFTLFMTFIYFSVNIGAPFIGIYMLEELNFNYIEYVMVNLSMPLWSIVFYSIFGYLSDKYGNALLLRICGLSLPIVPILWLFLNDPLPLIFGAQLMSAFAWSGTNLAVSNFIYDNINTQQRGFYLAYNSLFFGMGSLLGGLLGSFLLHIVPIVFVSIYETLFLISGICRLIFVFIFLFRIKEVRVKK